MSVLIKIGPVVLWISLNVFKVCSISCVNVFCYFALISQEKRKYHFILTNKSPLHKDVLCYILLKLAWKILNFSFCFHLPFRKGLWPSFETKVEFLFPDDDLCQVLFLIGLVVMEKKTTLWNINAEDNDNNNDDDDSNGHISIRKAHFNPRFRLSKTHASFD